MAAGLHVELQVQLFAMSAVQAAEEEPTKRIFQDIIIHTEMDILYLPVTANILSTPQEMFQIGAQSSLQFSELLLRQFCYYLGLSNATFL